ncbi:MAG: MFS transporter [Deltaproteobacteria bacterium]|nr:MFS transporter [Deltaproteobacteria bacterium]
MIKTDHTHYKWFILALGTATYFFTIGIGRPCIPVLFKEILDELGFSIFQIGTIWGMDSFAGALVALPTGLLIDRYSVRRVLTLVCLSIGFFGAARGLSTGFLTMSLAMFLFGLFAPMTTTLIPKVIAIYFDKRSLGLANSISIMGITIGAMISASMSATFLSPVLGGWRNVLFLYGALPIIVGVMWYLFIQDSTSSGADRTVKTVPFKDAFLRVVKIRQIWLLGFILFGHMGAYGGFIGYLPVYLRELGWPPIQADGALTLFLGLITLASIPMALLSDRLGSRKKILVPSLTLSCVTLGLVPLFNGLALWLVIICHGLARGGLMALLRALVVETKGIGLTYAGTATGLTNILLMLGYALFPPLGNSLAHIHLGLPFVLWASLSGLALISFIDVKEEA